jgi:protein-disulfide isomerase/uncharacterized membrane protein
MVAQTTRTDADRARAAAAPVSRAIPPIPLALWILGAVFALAAVGAVGPLVYKHFTNAALPGCHAGSACDQLETHILGRIKFPHGLATALGFGKWPTSFLGLAYFVAIFLAWLAAARRIAPGLRAMIRLGALLSLVYMIVIVVSQKYCKYCMASHAANFALLACMEVGIMMSRRSSMSANPVTAPAPVSLVRRCGLASLVAFGLGFVGVSGVLGFKEYSLAMAAGNEARASQDAMVQKAKDDAAKAAASATGDDSWDFGPKGFTGRYRLGPEKAPVRIVIFGAYTCQFCRQMEQQALDLVERNPGKVSFSFKHFPMNSDCNPFNEKSKDPPEHRNACWAARCAEACAIWAGADAALKGEDQATAANEAFWKAHKWLYSILGAFDDNSLMAGLKALGFDADKVTELMTKPAVNNNVVKDVQEGHALGLFQTPMIFINGVELKGWQKPGELQKAVATLLAANAPAVDATNDKPDLARAKAIDDWRQETLRDIAADKTPRALGKADAPVQVVVFGDFQEENTRKVDLLIRGMISGPGGLAASDSAVKPIRYNYRAFPGDKSCNDKLFKTFFEHGCLTAKAAEAAGLVGGDAAYWKMHDWLVNNPTPMGLDSIKKGARAIGLDGDAVVASLNKPEVLAAIQDDVAAANAIAVGQIPAVYVNGRFVKTWTRENDNVLGRIIDEAARKK